MTQGNQNGSYRGGADRPRGVGSDESKKNMGTGNASRASSGNRPSAGSAPNERRASRAGSPSNARQAADGRNAAQANRRVNPSYSRLKKRRRALRMRRILAAACLLLLCAAVWSIVRLISASHETVPDVETFFEGVSVDGLSLSGLTQDKAREAIDERYADVLDTEITMTFGDQSWTLTADDACVSIDADVQLDAAWQMGREGTSAEQKAARLALQENPVDLDVTLSYDHSVIEALAAAIKASIDCDPVDATMEIVEIAQFSYTDSSVGYSLDADKLVSQLEAMIEAGESGTLALEPEVIEPEVSRESLENKTVLLGECTTTLATSSSKRTSNVNLALSYFNFLTVEPGETVNFNKVVGKRTEKNGFKSAPEYAGSTVIEGVGGGVCQASTTIYGAVIRAGLTIVERHAHTMTVGYVQPSQDAAVSDGDKNMRFKNNTESTLYIFAYVDRKKEEAVCKIFGQPIDPDTYIEIESVVLQTDISGKGITYVKDEEGSHAWYTDEKVLKKEGKAGMRSEAYRVVYSIATGEEISREKLSTDSYQPEDDTYWVGVHER